MSDYRWLNDASQTFLERDYLLPGQSVDERVSVIADCAESILKRNGFAAKFKDYFKRGWFSLSTPIWSNFGTERGLPISCFGSYISDSMDSIAYTWSEVCMMTKHGGGTSAYFGEVRHRGAEIRDNGQSSGAVHFMRPFELLINTVSQGRTRRGNFAAYLPISHPDIMEFLSIRTEGHPIQDLSFGVTVADDWMESMIAGDKAKREVWARVLWLRQNVGYPYVIFIDNANKQMPRWYQEQQYRIYASNLCTEVFLPSSPEESFVCDLSSANVLYYDEWKNSDLMEVLVYFLDAVMTDFIHKASSIRFLERAVHFAENHRALGIGWIGWHSVLQSKMIPFESMEAKRLNVEIARTMFKDATQASQKMANEYGEPKVTRGYGQRHATLMAIAPTKSSAFILGQASEGIEPERSNYYIKDLAKGKFTIKNRYLQSLLASKGKDVEPVWVDILKHSGSVQHLPFLNDYEKSVFKTFAEISPKEIVVQAAQRQKYIDQGQSLNLVIHGSIPVKDTNALMIDAWRMGLKSLYYQIGVNAAQDFARNILACSSCES